MPGADWSVEDDADAVGFKADGAAGEIGVGDEGVIDPLGERGREGGGGHGESLGVTQSTAPVLVPVLSSRGISWVKFSGCGLRKKRVAAAIPDGCAGCAEGWRGASEHQGALR